MLRAIAKLNPPGSIGLAILTLLVAATGVSGPHEGTRPAAIASFPRLTVWAWENPEDLRALDPQRYAVAYLDQTIFIAPQVSSRPRFQRLLVSPQTRIIAVVRIEAGAPGAGLNASRPPRAGGELDSSFRAKTAHCHVAN